MTSRRRAVALLVAVLAVLLVAIAKGARGDGHHRVIGKGQVRFDGAGPERWAARYRKQKRLVAVLRRRLARQRYVMVHDPDVVEAINLAAATYGSGSLLWRIARRESNYVAGARNPQSTASGLFQFLNTTWANTPYGGFDVYSPYANALAAGWMIHNGHASAWSPLP